ncbi:hypothetical protein EON64_03325, partial [archaeon]
MSMEDQVLKLLGLQSTGVGAGLGPVDRLLALKNAVANAGSPPTAFRAASFADLLGRSTEERLQVNMWLSYARTMVFDAETLSSLNKVLARGSFLVGQALTLADIDLYTHLLDHTDLLSVESAVHVCRWFEHMQHLILAQDKKLFAVRPAAAIPLPVLEQTQAPAQAVQDGSSAG